MAQNNIDDTVKAVIAALDVFTGQPDKVTLERANTWLQDFQHTPDAWAVCNFLLLSEGVPDASRAFAAQTFRAKVTYDLEQVDPTNRTGLRDTLISALQRYAMGPRVVLIQICLALSGLALQMPEWQDPVQAMIDLLGQNPGTVPALLEFLTVLPEEVSDNTRIPMSNDDYREREAALLTANATEVLKLLAMYIQAPGVTREVQTQVFRCLGSWLRAGEVVASDMTDTPLFAFAFEALASDFLFDTAVDVICELIHETQEVDENMAVIQLIIPRLLALKPLLSTATDDPDRMRGYCRIFTEAGEMYRPLILQYTDMFFPIVEAIAECAAYPDLDIVPITFHFWYRLAQNIGKKPSVSPLLIDVYKALITIIIRHLHFPANPDDMNSQEKDDFRAFRHVMGDTLKDCCYVLGSASCLQRSYEMVTLALSRPAHTISWQEIEAPLFSMRSMGAEVDPNDDEVLPRIMDIITNLPAHPRVRYAATLVISRYTEWIDKHPSYIPIHLEYISAGFNDADVEVSAASGQAMKYLCKDCKRHLVPYLTNLDTFITTVGPKLPQDDRIQVYEAIAYVISSMGMEEAAQALRKFSLDIVTKIHEIVAKPTPATNDELHAAAEYVEQLEAMLYVIRTFGEELPPACQNVCVEVWAVFDALLLKYGSLYFITERCSRTLRLGLEFFGKAAKPILPTLLERLTASFEASGYSSNLWVIGKAVGAFGNENSSVIRSAYKAAYERTSVRVFAMLKSQAFTEIPDVIEDYIQMLIQMTEFTADVLFPSPSFPTSFGVVLSSLNLLQPEIVFASLDLVRNIIGHDALLPVPGMQQPATYTVYAEAIRKTVEQQGFQLVGLLLSGLITHFPEDSNNNVTTIFRILARLWPSDLVSWLPSVLEQLPTSTLPVAAKNQFFADVKNAIDLGQVDRVKQALHSLHRASRKARERKRLTKLDR